MKVTHLLLCLAIAPACGQRPAVVGETRAAINAQNLAAAEEVVVRARAASGNTAANLEALSWLGRGHLAAHNYDAANRFAAETRTRALELLKTRKLDDDESLPLALGASIEVQGQVLVARGQRAEAVSFLRNELKRWYATSIRTRIQKNINLVSLEGQAAPLRSLVVKENLGKPLSLAALRGKPVVLFFWAHWCGDCKQQGPVLARLVREFSSRGLTVVGPTRHYGYVAGGEEAPRDKESIYLGEVLARYYGTIPGMAVPVSEEAMKSWGASTTPTIALVDRQGIVRLYHPGRMTYEELLPLIQKVL